MAGNGHAAPGPARSKAKGCVPGAQRGPVLVDGPLHSKDPGKLGQQAPRTCGTEDHFLATHNVGLFPISLGSTCPHHLLHAPLLSTAFDAVQPAAACMHLAWLVPLRQLPVAREVIICPTAVMLTNCCAAAS
jgi:hypothetical protein